MKFSIRLLYLYLFSFVGLIIFVIGAIRIIQLGMNVYIFKGADQYQTFIGPTKITPDGKEVSLSQTEKDEQERQMREETQRQRQRELSGALSMIIVGYPLYKYHWSIISKENKKV